MHALPQSSQVEPLDKSFSLILNYVKRKSTDKHGTRSNHRKLGKALTGRGTSGGAEEPAYERHLSETRGTCRVKITCNRATMVIGTDQIRGGGLGKVLGCQLPRQLVGTQRSGKLA